jgi:enoyl-CoA hydratase
VTAADEILLDRQGGLATVTFNRPQALNALTLANYRRLDPVLRGWASDPSVAAVLVRGAGGRAFCVGGDVRALYRAGTGQGGDPDLPRVFFAEEYRLIRMIHRYPKPYIALIDGLTMGGGAGMAINGAFRVATERTLFAMPETAIGLFPDVGATRFLNRCPGRLGRYLGLTGERLQAADMLYCGLATHVAAQPRVEALIAALAETAPEGVGAVFDGFAVDSGPAPLAALRPAIDRCFAGDTVEAILDALVAEAAAGGSDSAWAAATRAGLLQKSPTSLKLTLRQLDLGRDLEIEAALALEYRMSQHAMAAHDFFEGVRALLIDKDQQPRWRPASLDQVDAAAVEAYFAPLGERELRFS